MKRLWTFEWSWQEKSPVTGRLVDVGETIPLHADRESALRAHEEACQGRWVKPGWRRPYVGPLVEWETPDDGESGRGLSRARRIGTLRDGQELDETPYPASKVAS